MEATKVGHPHLLKKRSNVPLGSWHAHDVGTSRRLAGCSSGRAKAIEPSTAETAVSRKEVLGINANAMSYGTNAQSTGLTLPSTNPGKPQRRLSSRSSRRVRSRRRTRVEVEKVVKEKLPR